MLLATRQIDGSWACYGYEGVTERQAQRRATALDISTLTVAQLEAELVRAGLPATGRKADLVARLAAALRAWARADLIHGEESEVTP